MKYLRYIAIALVVSLFVSYVGLAQIGVQVTASARQLCGSAASHELTINWNVTNLRGSAQIIIAITGPDGKTQTLNDSVLQGSKKVNVNYPLGGSVIVKVTAKTSSAEASNTATLVLTACTQPQGRLTANPKTVCNSRSSHEVDVSWSVTGAQLGNGTVLQLILTGPDNKQQVINLNVLQGQMTIPVNYPNGGTVTVILALTKAGSAQQILSRTAITLGQCLQANVQLTANPKSVCSSRASHEIEVNWNVTGVAAGTPIAIVIVTTGPDGRLQSQQASGAQGKATVFLNYPNGGTTTIEVIVRTGASTVSAATRVALSACKSDGGTETLPPGFGPGLKLDAKPDFVITDIEVSQGIQNLDNEMLLVAERKTIVRVYVRDLNKSLTGNVTAQLSGEFVTGSPFPSPKGSISPANKNGGRITVKPNGGQRRNLEDSFWFEVPNDWHADKNFTFKFTAEVNPPGSGQIAETKTDNNTKSVTVAFYEARPSQVRAVPLHFHEDWDRTKPEVVYPCVGASGEFWEIFLNMYRFHPISDLNVSCSSLLEPYAHNGVNKIGKKNDIAPREWDMRLEENDLGNNLLGCMDVNKRMAQRKANEINQGIGTWSYAGMVDTSLTGPLCYGFSGAASAGTTWTRMSVVHNPDWLVSGGVTLGHELGHDRGLNHVLCSGWEGPPNGTVDTNFPYPADAEVYQDFDGNVIKVVLNKPCRMTAADPEGFYGLDVYYALWNYLDEPSVLHNDDPAMAYPLLGYLEPNWIEPYSYCRLLSSYLISKNCNAKTIDPNPNKNSLDSKDLHSHLLKVWQPYSAPMQIEMAQNAQEFVLVDGQIDLKGEKSLIENVAIQAKDQLSEQTLKELEEKLRQIQTSEDITDFSLDVRDANGRTLYSQKILAEVNFHDRVTIMPFSEVLVFPQGATTVALVNNKKNAVVAALTRSANTPTVRLLSPNGGERLQPGSTMRWEASDADGDGLLFTLLYSPDGGQSWQIISDGLSGTEYRLENLNGFSGSTNGLLRVEASDGFNTSDDTSGRAFTVPGSAPLAHILIPKNEQTFTLADRLRLKGIAVDAESNSTLTYLWSSDLNGELGKTQELTIEPNTLKLGKHKLTLIVKDSDGMTGQASIEITVQKEPDRGPLSVSLTTNAKQTCGDSSKGSHELTLNWEAIGGQPPVKVTINFTGPDGLTDKLSEQPAKGEQTIKLAYPGGGTLKVEIVAEDSTGAKASKPATIQLSACR
jgi:hypothetical protein